ncbi:MAG: virulence protein SciE type [Gammaproteobacteria bacterium]|nr:virulence protein SciE type [Gammaproteobacteria bacterium]MDH3431646.1 virulence protein SciE type [Gammaproteobacteria bacterium]MDH3433867.1 virulence protein SciE type [Gammaproteobacteria bacterium]
MLAQDYLKGGDLGETLNAVKQAVRDDPSKAENRTFLFQLLSVTGEWERALNQLNVAGELDSSALPMVQTYREALGCEALREKVFAGERSPLVFGDPEQWIAMVLESVKLSAQGKHAEAAQLRDQAYESAPAVPGSINGEPFDWIADADSRIGPFVEAIVNGNYYWIPMHRITAISIEPPEDLRDLVWIPAQFSWANGGQSVGLIPVRYPDTQNCDKDALILGRLTEWSEQSADTYCGLGQRMFATDQNDYPLLEVREIKFDVSAPTETAD